MLKMIEGAEIKDFDKLNEEYEIKAKRIVANVNADKILNMFYDFIDMNDDLYFLILEIPIKTAEEEKLKENGKVKSFHKDVYYRDGMSKEFAKEILSKIGNLFINDGVANIGIGMPKGTENFGNYCKRGFCFRRKSVKMKKDQYERRNFYAEKAKKLYRDNIYSYYGNI